MNELNLSSDYKTNACKIANANRNERSYFFQINAFEGSSKLSSISSESSLQVGLRSENFLFFSCYYISCVSATCGMRREFAIMDSEANCEAYNSAKNVDYKFRDYFIIFCNFVSAFAEIFLVLVSETLTNIFNLFISKKPKSISDQIALVTGN